LEQTENNPLAIIEPCESPHDRKPAMPVVIAIVQSKGGAGKTSLTVHLACALGGRKTQDTDVRKRVALVDLDPLMSLAKWFRLREECIGPDPRLSIYSGVGWRAQGEIERAKRESEIVIIDAPPQDEAALRTAVRAAAVTVVPMQLSPMDLWATRPTLELISREGGKALIVLNRVPPRARVADSLVAQMTKAGMPLSRASLGNRTAFVAALIDGKGVTEADPRSAAATEIRLLADELLHSAAQSTGTRRACHAEPMVMTVR
jgi:chromosome partitioning protein